MGMARFPSRPTEAELHFPQVAHAQAQAAGTAGEQRGIDADDDTRTAGVMSQLARQPKTERKPLKAKKATKQAALRSNQHEQLYVVTRT